MSSQITTLFLEIIRDLLLHAIERQEVREDIDLEPTTQVIQALTIAMGDNQLLPYLNTYFHVSDETIRPGRTMDAMIDLIRQGIGTEI